MILLSPDCLLFQTADGESIPCSAELVSIELMGDSASKLDPDLIRHISAAVFHYFKDELGRESVSVGEFSVALERVLRGFGFTVKSAEIAKADPDVAESDLRHLVAETDSGCELFFFPRLRNEVRSHLQRAPRVLHFCGLRGCVKQLAGARRWTPRCQHLQDQIVEFLRSCLSEEHPENECALVVH